MKHLTYTLVFLTAMFFTACGDSPITPIGGEGGDPGIEASTFGLVEVTITGIGTDQMAASARPAASTVAAAMTPPGTGTAYIQIEPLSNGSYTVGPRPGGYRYIWATFKVRNAAAVGSNPTYANPRTNLTFIAVDTDATSSVVETYGETLISSMADFIGDPLPNASAIAGGTIPTGRVSKDKNGMFGDADIDVLQVFTETEIASISNVPTGSYLFPYGFVVSNPATPGSRTLLGGPSAGQFDGRVTFAFKLPLQTTANADPFEIKAMFLPVDDSETRMTQSIQAQDAAFNPAITARANALGAGYVTVFPGSEFAGTRRVLCTPVRIAGQTPASADYNTLFAAPPTFTSLDPVPHSATSHKIPLPVQFKATFSSSLNATHVKSNTFVIHGQQSGRQFVNQAYSVSGAVATAPSGSFFSGEMVEVSLTTGLGICPGRVARYRVEATAGTGAFGAKTNFTMGDDPNSVALGDLNGDGVLDIVTTNPTSQTVSVRRSNGTEATFTVGGGPRAVALGDLNGDGSLDIVSANALDDNVSIRLGDGAGGSTYSVVGAPFSVALGDLNGDGSLDMVTANALENNVSVRLGDGSGGFGSEATFTVGDGPLSVALGDLNGDGVLDMVTANNIDDNVSVRLGDGVGGFGSEATFLIGDEPYSVALGDLDGDGVLDMVTANRGSDNVSVRLGNVTGAFGTEATFTMGDEPNSVALGDLDGNGILDMVTTNRGSDNVSVRLGDGAGAFGTEATFTMGDDPNSVALGDLNGDGGLDIVTTNSLDDNISVRLNQ